MRALTGGEPSCPRRRAPKTARTAQKIPSVPLSMDEIHFRMCGATVYEISRLERCLRDSNTAAQHLMVSDSSYELHGQLALDLPIASPLG